MATEKNYGLTKRVMATEMLYCDDELLYQEEKWWLQPILYRNYDYEKYLAKCFPHQDMLIVGFAFDTDSVGRPCFIRTPVAPFTNMV